MGLVPQVANIAHIEYLVLCICTLITLSKIVLRLFGLLKEMIKIKLETLSYMSCTRVIECLLAHAVSYIS